MTQTLTAVLHKEGDLFVAECPEVGTVSQGVDIEGVSCNHPGFAAFLFAPSTRIGHASLNRENLQLLVLSSTL